MDRKAKLNLIWRHMHRDYRGKADGVRWILTMVPGVGTCSVALDSLDNAEVDRRAASLIARGRK